MDLFAFVRMIGALSVVLGMLAAALWLVRRFGLRLSGAVGTGRMDRRIEIVERLALDGKRSVALVRRDGREHLILLSPDGPLVIETGIVRDRRDAAAAGKRARELEVRRISQQEAMAALGAKAVRLVDWLRKTRRGGEASFASLVETACARLPAKPEPVPVITATALIAARCQRKQAA